VDRPKGVVQDDGFCISFLFLQLFLMKFQLLPILRTNMTYVFPILSDFSFYFKFCIT
jgi:hypothetical protein